MTKTARVIHLLTEDKIVEGENPGFEIIELEVDLDRWDDISQKMIGGYIEIVHPSYLPDSLVMLVDEDGHSKGLPINPHASVLYGVNSGSHIVGDAWIMVEGERGSHRNDDWTKTLESLPENYTVEDMASILHTAIELQLDGK